MWCCRSRPSHRSTSCRCGERFASCRWRNRKRNCAIPIFVVNWLKRSTRHRETQVAGSAPNHAPAEVFIDLALEKHLKQFFLQPLVNENQDHVLEMIKHPRSVVTFSDSGAHVS